MPDLEADFRFTQVCLQDYLDCKRRFQLRYLIKQPWPAHVVEPADAFEHHIEQGKQFHRLVQQYVLGIQVEVLNRFAVDPPLADWWQAFLKCGLEGIPEVRFPEHTRATSLAGYGLVGKYDLIALSDAGEVWIVDWKTSRRVPGMNELRLRMQSRVYPFILSREGLRHTGNRPIEPDRITMRYWFAGDPRNPKEFTYHQEQYAEDQEFLENLIHEIEMTADEVFPLTEDKQVCRFCLYRSLCDRGVEAGSFSDLVSDVEDLGEWPEGIDLDQIEEIAF
ncbi:MAG: PD-(D/E)XK nuclease family protein [Anaerolineales bacterium]|nr:PD-(D/E)XK nuclease family protein [Anaerolineales bacterium]